MTMDQNKNNQAVVTITIAIWYFTSTDYHNFCPLNMHLFKQANMFFLTLINNKNHKQFAVCHIEKTVGYVDCLIPGPGQISCSLSKCSPDTLIQYSTEPVRLMVDNTDDIMVIETDEQEMASI